MYVMNQDNQVVLSPPHWELTLPSRDSDVSYADVKLELIHYPIFIAFKTAKL